MPCQSNLTMTPLLPLLTIQPNNPVHTAYARKLYEAVRREFPELRAYRVRPAKP